MARIFISHSANSDAFAASVRDVVAERLHDMGHEPLVDQKLIHPGDRWRPKLLRWLGSCHGAVFLFTSRALNREWVRTESTILGWRACLDPAMRLVPVLLDDDVSSESLDTLGLRPVQIRDVEMLKSSDVKDAESAASWANAIAARFNSYQAGPANADDPMAHWLDTVAKCLEGNLFLERAAKRLGISELDSVDIEGSLARTVADRLLLHSRPFDIEEAVLELCYDSGLCMKTFAALVSCAWLPAEMAPILYEVAMGGAAQRVLAVGVSRPKTPERLLRRLTCCNNFYSIIEPPGIAGTGADEEGELTERYVSSILRRLGVDSEAYWDGAIRPLRERRRPVFVILDPEAVEAGILGRLSQRLGGLVFVCAVTRERLEQSGLGFAPLPAIELTPRLPEEVETEGDPVAGRLENYGG